MKLVCAVLAAGASTRMGTPKQLLVYRGQTLLERTVDVCTQSGLAQVAVVVGAHAERMKGALPGALTLHNPDWPLGLASSLHTAVRWASSTDADGLLLCTCDQPLLSPDHLRALRASFKDRNSLVASAYAGTRGIPALLGAAHYPRLLALTGDRGAGALLRGEPSVIEIAWPDGALDLDTPEEFAALERRDLAQQRLV